MNRILSPSMLSADFGNLARDTRMVDRSAARWVHVDVMDGVFVPNISFGFPVLRALKAATTKPLDVHLMIVEPERYVERFVAAGADSVTVHIEALRDPAECIAIMRNARARVGLSLRPGTPLDAIEPWLADIDLVLVMSVEPGFGGQSFMPDALARIKKLRTMVGEHTLIEVDGGISAANAGAVWAAGADVVVAGNAIFGAPDPEAEIENILRA